MMHQPIDPSIPDVALNDRPDHPTVISNDEVLDLIIDMETLGAGQIFEKYFAS